MSMTAGRTLARNGRGGERGSRVILQLVKFAKNCGRSVGVWQREPCSFAGAKQRGRMDVKNATVAAPPRQRRENKGGISWNISARGETLWNEIRRTQGGFIRLYYHACISFSPAAVEPKQAELSEHNVRTHGTCQSLLLFSKWRLRRHFIQWWHFKGVAMSKLSFW